MPKIKSYQRMLPLEPKKHEQSIEVEKGNIGE
jgi:hypothetical protein